MAFEDLDHMARSAGILYSVLEDSPPNLSSNKK